MTTKSTTVDHRRTTCGQDVPCSRGSGTPFTLSFRLMRRIDYSIPQMGVVVCRLWRILPRRGDTGMPPFYGVELAFAGQRRVRSVGRDASRAAAIMDLLVRNTVTPCTLGDVLEDLLEDSDDGTP